MTAVPTQKSRMGGVMFPRMESGDIGQERRYERQSRPERPSALTKQIKVVCDAPQCRNHTEEAHSNFSVKNDDEDDYDEQRDDNRAERPAKPLFHTIPRSSTCG